MLELVNSYYGGIMYIYNLVSQSVYGGGNLFLKRLLYKDFHIQFVC